MPTLTIELPAHADQTAFNLRRWKQLSTDPQLVQAFSRYQGRIETNRHGHVIMYPPAAFPHGSRQGSITVLLAQLMAGGRPVPECPISTADGVRAADVAWISSERIARLDPKVCLTKAPEICVEVLSPDNTRAEMSEKKALYFAAGADEVWFCDQKGKMTFFVDAASAGEKASRLCPKFPKLVEA